MPAVCARHNARRDLLSRAQRARRWRRLYSKRRRVAPRTFALERGVYPRIFDTHVHFPRNWEKPEEDPAGPVEHLFERLAECNIQKAALLSGGRWGPGYEECLKLLRPFESVAI